MVTNLVYVETPKMTPAREKSGKLKTVFCTFYIWNNNRFYWDWQYLHGYGAVCIVLGILRSKRLIIQFWLLGV